MTTGKIVKLAFVLLIVGIGVYVHFSMRERTETRPNVLLIGMDTLRRDHVGFMGCDRPVSPNLDALAREGAVFTNAYSQSGWTMPSMGTIFNGLYPHAHGATDFHRAMNRQLPTIASVLQDRGYDTRAFVSHLLLTAEYGFNRGFVKYDYSVLRMGHPHDASTATRLTELAITDLDKLGLQGKAKEDFLKAIHSPQGIVILTGPTGSGKTYTLNAGVHQVISPEVNVLTVEDPVELMIEGARQIKISSEKLTFEQAVRAILRHDPDIVMVGEMRDLETAQTAIKLANTGHLTFSTLHTNDAPSAVSRLYKMGVEPFLIANAINIVVAQRLIRKLCAKCKRPIEDLDPSIPLSLGFTEEEIKNTTFYEAAGCDGCRNGYKGRVAIHEALLFTKEIRRLILASGDTVDEEAIREQAIQDGMLTLRAAGRVRIKQGLTSFEEVAAITSEN